MNQAVSASTARSKGDACHTSAPVKRIANTWLIAAHQVLQALGYGGDRAAPGGVDLYVSTDGDLLAVERDAPPGAVYVCRLKPGIDVVVVAARLRHATSRWRKDYPATQEDND